MNADRNNGTPDGIALYALLVVAAGLAIIAVCLQVYYPQSIAYVLAYLLLVAVGLFMRQIHWVVSFSLLAMLLNAVAFFASAEPESQMEMFNLFVAQVAILLVGLAIWGHLMRETWHRRHFEVNSKLDWLTGLNNMQAMIEHIDRQERVSARYGTTFSLLLIDVDGMHIINDQFGRGMGDRVLCDLPEAIADLVRDTDILGRFKEDQFIMLCSETNLQGARQMALRIHQRLAEVPSMSLTPNHRVSVSIGVAEHNQGHKGVEALLKVLNRALDKAKQDGKNRVVSYPFSKAGAQMELPHEQSVILH